MTDESWTIGKLVQWTQGYFSRKGIESPRLDAEILLAHTLGLKRIELYTNYDRPVPEEHRAKFRNLVERRAERCPAAYITGGREFMSLEFRVTPDVLIPRPETEFVVESVLELAPGSESADLLIADIGTGSGCICVSLATRLGKSRFLATDISEAALAVARDNAGRHGVAERITFLRGDMLEPLAGGEFRGKINFLLSNPPYVSDEEWRTLMPEVRDYEPKEALLAGGDFLKYYRSLAAGGAEILAPGGCAIVEVGRDRAESVKKIFEENPAFCGTKLVKDYQRIDRIVIAAKPALR
ncbi:MAG: peptide chain release factor N(5)-glutamine methyltransferase [Planctomycetota bacterium]